MPNDPRQAPVPAGQHPLALRHAVDLAPFNTFALPARARTLVEVRDVATVRGALAARDALPWPWLVLGGGSNVVLTGDFPGLVLQVRITGRERLADDDNAIRVRAGGGENWHAFVQWTLANGWPGLENLALIPGTVGAAPIQNIGAYGLELSERFESLRAISLEDGREREFSRDQCRFGYRDSVFKRGERGRWLITSVTFRLPRPWRPVTRYAELERELAARGLGDPQPRDVADAVIAIRRRKLPDPADLGNAGSFFKNPVVAAPTLGRLLEQWPALPHYPQADGRFKIAAGWLIDQCGWKGRSVGAVGCHAQQALVLVNHGGARGEDVVRVARAVAEDVRRRFGVELEAEPTFI